MSGSTVGSCSMTQSGNFYLALNPFIHSVNSWIIDLGVSNHMTGKSNHFILIFHDRIITLLKLLMDL